MEKREYVRSDEPLIKSFTRGEYENTFENRKKLGEGGNGVVFKALKGNREVALKKMRIEKKKSAIAEFNALKDVGCMSGLICYRQIFTVGKNPEFIYIEMDYYKGSNLFEVIKDHIDFTIPELVSIFKKLINALNYIHSNGIVHQDIKLENIVLTAAGPILIDFGSTCSISTDIDKCYSPRGSVLTTPPELLFIRYCLFSRINSLDKFSMVKKLFPEIIFYYGDIWCLGLVFKSLLLKEVLDTAQEGGVECTDNWHELEQPVLKNSRTLKSHWEFWLKIWKHRNSYLIDKSSSEVILDFIANEMLNPDYKDRFSLKDALEHIDDFERRMN